MVHLGNILVSVCVFAAAVAAETAEIFAQPAHAEQKGCSSSTIDAILSADQSPFDLTCSATLPAGAQVGRQIVFGGDKASNVVLDCNGGTLRGAGPKADPESVIVRSTNVDGRWNRPVGVIIRNCVILGGVRIYGLGRNGQSDAVRQSSLNADHTQFAQQVAPNRISMDRITFELSDRAAIYVGPGVTEFTLTNSSLSGSSSGVGIYLDAESAGARITNNVFDIRSRKREIIAVDSSAGNEISHNTFNDVELGGIFLYRNCGEGGTIRHQAPQYNTIEDNSFTLLDDTKPAVWLGSREGKQSYCFHDPAHPFGSSVDSSDLATNNTVEGNDVIGGDAQSIKASEPANTIGNNRLQ